MKVLVTGGAGYIGSVLVPLLLKEGYDVTVVDRLFFGREPLEDVADKVKIIRDDIRWFDPAILNNVDAVLDLASLSNDPSGQLNEQKTLDINYSGRVRVAKLAKERSVKKYILASTCSVYGASDQISNEKSPLNPLTAYARANALAERDILPLGDNKFSTTALRQATVYGLSKRMRFDLAINAMVLSFFKNGRVKIMRDGKQWRPFVHVKDTSRAFLRVLEADNDIVNREVFNVGSNDQNYQIFDLAKLVSESIGMKFEYEWYGSPDVRNYRVSFDKIKRQLGFQPEHTPVDASREIYDALKNGEVDGDDPRWITVEWYKKLLSSPDLAKEVELNGVIL
ncbi:MAG: SDR family oxidoreductase [Metallosphaera sp.]|uniref:NAD-dependent epimerase/dehydratase family protein n=1 Tax=Metallosphaera sp. TaxID=2020860 RepID=UPI00315E1787